MTSKSSASAGRFADSATEQKMWIQCTQQGTKARGEDWIEADFKEDDQTGCSACLPDIMVVNDANEFTSKAFSASWQRILTKAEAENHSTPVAANVMPFADLTSVNDAAFLYNHRRFERVFLPRKSFLQ